MNCGTRLLVELRQLAAADESPCGLARLVLDRLGLDADHGRITVIAYFQRAFHLSLADAMRIGAAPIFRGESRPASHVDMELRPLLDATRDAWHPP
jgi:hypothetical protein